MLSTLSGCVIPVNLHFIINQIEAITSALTFFAAFLIFLVLRFFRHSGFM